VIHDLVEKMLRGFLNMPILKLMYPFFFGIDFRWEKAKFEGIKLVYFL